MPNNTSLEKQDILFLSKNDSVLLFGASGFIGSVLLRQLLDAPQETFAQVTLATRNPAKLLPLLGKETDRFQVVTCDHIDVRQLKRHIPNCSVILDLAGLAWQHPGGKPLPPTELLKKQLLHNSISAYILSTILQPQQRLVWTSTSAIDSMFARLSPDDQSALSHETAALIEQISATISPKLPPPELEKKVSELVDTFTFSAFPIEPNSSRVVCFATEFSYAYSKYVGQLLLARRQSARIRVLKISDVYGPGQDISADILNPLVPARRIQRYLAAYLQIKSKNYSWIPEHGDLFGFSKDKHDTVKQKIWSDWVLPTHVADVCKMILRALDPNISKNVLEVNGGIMKNSELMETLQVQCQTNVEIVTNAPLGFTMTEHSQDLTLVGMSPEQLLPLSTGLADWTREVQLPLNSPLSQSA